MIEIHSSGHSTAHLWEASQMSPAAVYMRNVFSPGLWLSSQQSTAPITTTTVNT